MADCVRPPRHVDNPTYWFVRLEMAVQRGDFREALNAQQQLARHGVVVQYGRPQPSEVANAAR